MASTFLVSDFFFKPYIPFLLKLDRQCPRKDSCIGKAHTCCVDEDLYGLGKNYHHYKMNLISEIKRFIWESYFLNLKYDFLPIGVYNITVGDKKKYKLI